ncbi:MAG: hypothetical protein WAM82_25710 [Thermoanaerobaculia bacterium]
MKSIDAAAVSTFSELLDLAEEETVRVTTPDGREFILVEIDDFAEEIEAVGQSRELIELLEERSKEKAKGGHSLAEVKKRLGLD